MSARITHLMALVFIKGLVLGLVAGVPLGPASAAVADTALRKTLPRAIAVGLGGAMVDIAYCMAAVAGLGAVFDNRPGLKQGFLAAGGLVLVAFGLYTARKGPLPARAVSVRRPMEAGNLLGSMATGALISVANPALVISWILLAGTVLTGLDTIGSLVAGVGVFMGVFSWFCVVAWLAHKGRLILGEKAIWIPRAAGIILVVYGAYLILRITLFHFGFSPETF
ncbi:MAG: LysE family transporter [Deltaproteobacteria bacterium]|nr:LysE family transporter [Deltaproteobacteria bacterium]